MPGCSRTRVAHSAWETAATPLGRETALGGLADDRVQDGEPRQTAQRAAVPDGAVRTAPLVAIPRLLRDLGQDPAAILAEAGIDPGLLADGERTISFASAGRLLAICAARTGCDHFGLILGQTAGLECLGLVGMLAQCSPDLGTALRSLVLHLHVYDRGAIPTLSVGEHEARFGYAIYRPEAEGTAQTYDLALAIGCNLLRALCGARWQPAEVLLSHARPGDIGPYRRAFRARLRFDAERSAMVFPASWLATPLPGAHPRRYRMLEARIGKLTATDGKDLAARVRRIACDLMLDGKSSLGAVADALALHPRTLNRRLRQQGSSYWQLSEDCRQASARQLLRDTELAIADIAAVLSYSDVTVFTRAFRRWSGATPGAWRSAQRRAHVCCALR
jgi:AraC-like DNA-binding protein